MSRRLNVNLWSHWHSLPAKARRIDIDRVTARRLNDRNTGFSDMPPQIPGRFNHDLPRLRPQHAFRLALQRTRAAKATARASRLRRALAYLSDLVHHLGICQRGDVPRVLVI